MKQIVLGLVVLALVATTAYAHGGAYRGPAGEVPPNMRKPEDPPPPSDQPTPTPEEPPPDNGTPTPGDKPGDGRPAPVPPPGSEGDGGPKPVGPKAPGGDGGGAGAVTGGPRKSSAPPPTTFDIWAFWWGYNKDDILNLKATLKNRETKVETGGGALNVGGVHERSKAGTQTVTDSKIREVVIPALERVLANPDAYFDTRAAAVIAIGKIGATQKDLAPSIGKQLIDIMNNKSGNEHFSVEESGALALGLLQLKDKKGVIVNALCDKALDRRGSTKNQRTRAFACLALGLLQVNAETDGKDVYDRVVETLRTIVKDPNESLDDLPVCALMAMGLSGDPIYKDELLAMVKEGRAYKTKKLKDLVQSYAASAVGKIADTNSSVATKATVDVFKKAMISAGPNTVRSAVIAFGQIGSQKGVDRKLAGQMISSLDYIVKKGETQAANFALISLGKIGAAIDDSKLRNRIYDTLRTSMKKGSYTSKPFAALSLGLMGRTQTDPSSKAVFAEAIRFEFNEYKGDPKNQGAYALALGMLSDREAVPAMVKILEDRGAVRSLRGSCAIALGMIGDYRAHKAVKSALEEPEDRDLRIDTAVAAGLLGDADSIQILIEILTDKKASLFVQGSVSLALGRIGDHRAIDPLVKMLEDEKVQKLNRALAAVALGLLGDRRDLPVMTRIAKDVNYRAQINSMEEVLSIL